MMLIDKALYSVKIWSAYYALMHSDAAISQRLKYTDSEMKCGFFIAASAAGFDVFFDCKPSQTMQ